MAVELSAEADCDLADLIASGLDRYGLAASDKYVARLREAFEMIGTFPRIARARDEIDGAPRGFPVGMHIIFYQVDDMDNILILRIRHGREDWLAD